MDIRKSLILAGVKNLKEYGYPDVSDGNILTDVIYAAFFASMLRDNLGAAGSGVDAVIGQLLAEIEATQS